MNISASVKIVGVWATGISTSITSTIQKHEPSVKEIIISLNEHHQSRQLICKAWIWEKLFFVGKMKTHGYGMAEKIN